MLRDALAQRIFFDEPVTLFVASRPLPISGRAVDLSAGGIFVILDGLPVASGDALQLSFALPGGGDVHAAATVVRVVEPETPAQRAGLALRFDDMADPCAVALDQFIDRRLQPPAGDPVRLVLDETQTAVRAVTQQSWSNIVAVDAELPFLRLGSSVQLEATHPEAKSGGGAIRWVSVHVCPESGVPRINIGIEMAAAPAALVDDADDPVCTSEFGAHVVTCDQQVRAERRAAR